MLRMLVVDDEPTVTFAMETFFRAQAFEVDTASEMEEAQALLAVRDYDVVVSDLRLSGINAAEGLDVLALARERHPRAVLLLVTAFGTPVVLDEVRRRGADSCLAKPFSLPLLAGEVTRLLDGKRG